MNKMVTGIGIVLAALLLAACSTPQKPSIHSILDASAKAKNKLHALDNIAPTPYNPSAAPTTFLGYTVVDGVDPHMFSPLAIKELTKQAIFADTSWWQLMPAPNVFTITAGRLKGSIIMKSCEQGVIHTSTHIFDGEPTLGPAIPAGTPIAVPIKKNGKIVMIDGHAAIKTEPAPPGMHQPGPFYAFGNLMYFNGKKWVDNSPLGDVDGNWSCSNA